MQEKRVKWAQIIYMEYLLIIYLYFSSIITCSPWGYISSNAFISSSKRSNSCVKKKYSIHIQVQEPEILFKMVVGTKKIENLPSPQIWHFYAISGLFYHFSPPGEVPQQPSSALLLSLPSQSPPKKVQTDEHMSSASTKNSEQMNLRRTNETLMYWERVMTALGRLTKAVMRLNGRQAIPTPPNIYNRLLRMKSGPLQ